MEFRRDKSKILAKKRDSEGLFEDDLLPRKNNSSTSTPVRGANVGSKSEEEESPCFTGFTQELLRDDVDVLWDYSSPQSRRKKVVSRKPKKKLNLTNHPTKVEATSRQIRRHNSNNIDQIKQDFCELRQELMALKAAIAMPDHEESLILSPREEEAFNRTQESTLFDDIDIGHFESQDRVINGSMPHIDDLEDPFDDGMDDKLFMFSQQVEIQLEQNCDINKPSTSNQCGISKTETRRLTNSFKTKQTNTSEVFNDSFDQVLSQIADDDLDQLTQVVGIEEYRQNSKLSLKPCTNSKVFPRSRSENIVDVHMVTQRAPSEQKPGVSSSKMQLQRTQSFESYGIAPMKCSPEEIEKKRREALAKLEAKRVQELIERKKQEALKRREESKRRHAQQQNKSILARTRM
ncbi:uncharacterized protein LOC126736895 isoform X2 [Anthonomus grandis grandis]|uniref:uncharacterized protein LOC126736895 isoform X2 n=1 Tax=Anthonomus grandis grandis TaxID=2921223 RepID=UPI002164F7D2|nr:uncharacterized protein LOC126736895 isoform X2 [Anthonomus grandis grandis]